MARKSKSIAEAEVDKYIVRRTAMAILIAVIIAAVVLLTVFFYYKYSAQQQGSSNGATTSIASNQNQTHRPSLLFCIGGTNFNYSGFVNRTFYATLSASGIVNWTQTTPLPDNLSEQSCFGYNSSVYCIGGKTSTYSSAVYVAPLYIRASSQGNRANVQYLLDWKFTTSYGGGSIIATTCVPSGGYVYCIGGINTTRKLTGQIFAAQLSARSIGNWAYQGTYAVPVVDPSCTSINGYIYCVGGHSASSAAPAQTYSAKITNHTIQYWSVSANGYPTNITDQSCVSYKSTIYCIGGASVSGATSEPRANVYYSNVSSGYVGAWKQATQYPVPVAMPSCTEANSYIYCTAGSIPGQGTINQSYYAPIQSDGTLGAWQQTASYPLPNSYSLSCATI